MAYDTFEKGIFSAAACQNNSKSDYGADRSCRAISHTIKNKVHTINAIEGQRDTEDGSFCPFAYQTVKGGFL